MKPPRAYSSFITLSRSDRAPVQARATQERKPASLYPNPGGRLITFRLSARALAATSVILLATLFGVPADAQLRAQAASPDVTIQQFLNALRERDTTSLRSVLHQTMRLTSVIHRGEQRDIMMISADDLVTTVSRATGAPWNQRLRNPVWSTNGSVAALWSRYTFHRGEAPDHCGIIAVQLARVTEGWKVLQVTDTHETAGCDWPDHS